MLVEVKEFYFSKSKLILSILNKLNHIIAVYG